MKLLKLVLLRVKNVPFLDNFEASWSKPSMHVIRLLHIFRTSQVSVLLLDIVCSLVGWSQQPSADLLVLVHRLP